jgi:hypothetical protein
MYKMLQISKISNKSTQPCCSYKNNKWIINNYKNKLNKMRVIE